MSLSSHVLGYYGNMYSELQNQIASDDNLIHHLINNDKSSLTHNIFKNFELIIQHGVNPDFIQKHISDYYMKKLNVNTYLGMVGLCVQINNI